MSNNFKSWIQATKNDTKNLELTKTFLRVLLLSTDNEVVEHYSEITLLLNYLESDETEVSRHVEISTANILKLLAGGIDPENSFQLTNLRNSFKEKFNSK